MWEDYIYAFWGQTKKEVKVTAELCQYFGSDHKHRFTMIYDRWNHSQAPSKKPPHPSYTNYNKARHEFLTSSPNKHSIRDKTEE